nr:PAAR domain-containing protein [Massilia sp. TS11]
MNGKTDHGGEVVSVSSGTVVLGIEAALAGDMTYCPKCKGTFPITPGGAGAKHEGKPYAYDQDTTACGARLIASH